MSDVPATTGLVVLAIAVLAATVVGLRRRRTDGLVRPRLGAAAAARLGPEDIGHPLGDRVTFVQFSSAFCQPCRTTRQVLAHVASVEGGVEHVDIDAESHLGLVRRLGVTRTPTTLVLDQHGVVVGRATGALRLDQARDAVTAASND